MKLEQNMNLNDELDSLWEELDEEMQVRGSTYYPNSILPLCALRIFYEKSGIQVTDSLSLESLILMGYGSELHEIMYKRLDQKGWYHRLGEEVKITNNFHNIVYVVDKFIEIEGQVYVVEVKTVGGYPYNGTKYIPCVKDNPKEEHYLQLQVEMCLLDLPGMLIYFNRENGQDHMIPLQQDQEALSKIGSICQQLTRCLKNGKPPERKLSLIIDKDGLPKRERTKDKQKFKSDWQCFYGKGWCPYLSHCWKEDGLDSAWREILDAKKEK